MLKNYKHIIWDWNGTLFNDVDLCLDIINIILSNHALKKLSKDEYKEIFSFPVQNYYAEAGLDLKKYSFEILGQEWINRYEKRKNEGQLYDGVIKILNYISENEIEQSILSAYTKPTLEDIVRQFELDSYFVQVEGLDHIYATSKLELGKLLMQKLDCPAEATLLIGDSIHDYEVAVGIGADCILMADGHQSKKRLTSCGVPVVDDMAGLYSFLCENGE